MAGERPPHPCFESIPNCLSILADRRLSIMVSVFNLGIVCHILVKAGEEVTNILSAFAQS